MQNPRSALYIVSHLANTVCVQTLVSVATNLITWSYIGVSMWERQTMCVIRRATRHLSMCGILLQPIKWGSASKEM